MWLPSVLLLQACLCICRASVRVICVYLSRFEQQGPQVNAQLIALQRLTQAGPRMIGRYSNRQTILLVGEGDFSFALAVASAVGGDRMTCTSFDKLTQLHVKYENKVRGVLGTLQGLGASIYHDVDATALQDYEFMRTGDNVRKFSRIVFNFPCIGLLEDQQVKAAQEKREKELERKLRKGAKGKKKKDDDKKSETKSFKMEQLEQGRQAAAERRLIAERKSTADSTLLRAFFKCAKQHLEDTSSQIHVTLRRFQVETTGSRAVEKLAKQEGLVCFECCDFHPGQYPGYVPQQTHPNGKGLQPLTPAIFFGFRLRDDEEEDDEGDLEESSGEEAMSAGKRESGDEDVGQGVDVDAGWRGTGGVEALSDSDDDGRGVYRCF
jgi:hypothetical protein